ncbi:hypothetical protein MPH_02618 [Macrophomina phaseolina MS6]|uniref:Protein YIP n=1 Tax=Macrophomina phaseolina (strain MS6) TaxID=1126212 RepID=K2SCF8_MACPH|nr:hypothetical protein MPH_02618 [Macrophomina phaseolina MS6]
MANYYGASPQPVGGGAAAQNLNFYQSSYSAQPVSGHTTPFQAFTGGAASNAYAGAGFGGAGAMGGPSGFGGAVPGTLTVLNPLARIDQHIMDDSDLAGPILFFLLFGTFLLFSGKVHFGYIYGLALLGSTSLHMILSLMSPPVDPATASSSGHPSHPTTSSHFSSTLTFPRSASVLGYCLLPLVLTSLIGIVVPMDGLFGYILTTAAIMWCTYSSSAMFCAVGRMSGMRGLVAYPLGLFYVGFGIMAIFSSRGTGSLAAKTAAA